MADEQKQAPGSEDLNEASADRTDGTSAVDPAGSDAELNTETERLRGQNDEVQSAGIFSDLLQDGTIPSLHIEEPMVDGFDMNSVLEEARTISSKAPTKGSKLGKRIRRSFSALTSSENKPETGKEETAHPAPKKVPLKLNIPNVEDDENDEKTETVELKEEIVQFVPQDEKAAAKMALNLEKEEHVHHFLEDETMKTMEDLINSLPASQQEQNQEDDGQSHERELSFEELIASAELIDPSSEKPKTFTELLKSGFGKASEESKELGEDLFDSEEASAAAEQGGVTRKTELPSLSEKMAQMEKKKKEEAIRRAKEKAERKAQKEREAAEEDEVYDPKASLVDDYRYDEYLDRKSFLMSDYKKTEDYLNKQSRQGFHYVHHEGKKFYFIKGKPHNFYYKILYFAKEPGEDYWNQLEEEGWKEIDTSPSRNRRDAGWYVVRNERKEGDLTKVIENEEDKYRYFTKFSSSCRSTMFLLFIVIVCSALTMWLQYEFKGFLPVIIASGVLFVIALWIFLVYARLLNKSRKQALLLAARMRLADNDPKYQALLHAKDTDEELDEQWDEIDRQEPSEKKGWFSKKQ